MEFTRLARFAGIVAAAAILLGYVAAPGDAAHAHLTDQQLSANDLFNRAVERAGQGDYSGAIEDFLQVVRLNPGYAPAYVNLGNTRQQVADSQGALDAFNEAVRIDPNSPQAYYGRALARAGLGDRPGAIEDYSRAIDLNPN